MRTLIINGSPKAKDGNTEIFIEKFVGNMKASYEICYVSKQDPLQIANYLKEFDNVIVVMPLYVHAMPGIVMKLMECMEPVSNTGKSMGFIVQSGFMESAQSKYLERYLSAITKNLNYTYLGTVIRGGSAGTYMMPEKMNKKLFEQLGILGEYYDKNGAFDRDVVAEMAKPIKLSKGKCNLIQFSNRFGLGDSMFWNMVLKQNNARDKRFDKPFGVEYLNE
jgi:multimeric flavodoxin WrbA